MATVAEIKAELDALGTAYNSKALKAELVMLLERARGQTSMADLDEVAEEDRRLMGLAYGRTSG